MGMPAVQGSERFSKVAANGVTVWKSNAVQPLRPDHPIVIDRGWLLFFGQRLVVKNAR
jgi:hypothetical protein